MAGIPAHILNLYDQYDFIPEAIYNGWAAGGYTIGQIFEWLLVPLQMATAVLAAIGAEATSHASELAHVSIEDYESIISARDLMGQIITPVMRGKLRQVLLSARIVIGVTRAPDPPAPPPQPINTAATTSSTSQPIVVHAIMPPQEKEDQTQVVYLNDVVKQGCDIKVPRMSDEDFKAARRVYKKAEGDWPAIGESPTIEQASAFLALMIKFRNIAVGFAIFVPHGDRALMRRHWTSRVMDSRGNWSYVQVYGPPNFMEWMACWRVFTCLCIMLKVVSPGRLRRYADKIAGYVNRAPDAWGVIYQADVRTRTEHFPRILEKAMDYHAKALVNNWESDYNPQQPWEEVFRRAVCDETQWWFDTIEIPFQSIVPGGAPPEKFVESDAPVRGESSSHRSSDVPAPPVPVIPEGYTLVRKSDRGRGAGSEPPLKKLRTDDQHPKSRQGRYVTTKNGRPVCDGYNEGRCEHTAQWGRCGRDGESAHQCSVCLMVGRGAHQANVCPKQGGRPTNARQGGGGTQQRGQVRDDPPPRRGRGGGGNPRRGGARGGRR